MSKDKTKSTKKAINTTKRVVNKRVKTYRYTAREVAGLCGVSEGYVKKIRARLVEMDSPKVQQVLMVDETLYDGCTALLNEVNRILNQTA